MKKMIKMATVEKVLTEIYPKGMRERLAVELGLTPQRVGHIIKGGKIPAKYCRKIEGLTGGRLACEELCPEVFYTYEPVEDS